jgi:hypothetical protein
MYRMMMLRINEPKLN